MNERRFLETFIEYRVTNSLGFESPKPEGPETPLNLQYTLGRMDLNTGAMRLGDLNSATLMTMRFMQEDEKSGLREYSSLRTARDIVSYLSPPSVLPN